MSLGENSKHLWQLQQGQRCVLWVIAVRRAAHSHELQSTEQSIAPIKPRKRANPNGTQAKRKAKKAAALVQAPRRPSGYIQPPARSVSNTSMPGSLFPRSVSPIEEPSPNIHSPRRVRFQQESTSEEDVPPSPTLRVSHLQPSILHAGPSRERSRSPSIVEISPPLQRLQVKVERESPSPTTRMGKQTAPPRKPMQNTQPHPNEVSSPQGLSTRTAAGAHCARAHPTSSPSPDGDGAASAEARRRAKGKQREVPPPPREPTVEIQDLEALGHFGRLTRAEEEAREEARLAHEHEMAQRRIIDLEDEVRELREQVRVTTIIS